MESDAPATDLGDKSVTSTPDGKSSKFIPIYYISPFIIDVADIVNIINR